MAFFVVSYRYLHGANRFFMAEEESSEPFETCHIARSAELRPAALRQSALHLRVATEIVLQSITDGLALRHQDDFRMIKLLQSLLDDRRDERIVRASQDDGVDVGVGGKQGSKVGLNLTTEFGRRHKATFDERNPLRTGVRCEPEAVGQMRQLHVVRPRTDRRPRSDEADVTRIGQIGDSLDRWTNDAQDSPRGVVHRRELVLLDVAQSLGRCSVARQNDKRTTHRKQPSDSLVREVENLLKRAVAIRCAGIVAQEDIVVVWKQPMNLAEDAETAETTVKNADWSHWRKVFNGESEDQKNASSDGKNGSSE